MDGCGAGWMLVGRFMVVVVVVVGFMTGETIALAVPAAAIADEGSA